MAFKDYQHTVELGIVTAGITTMAVLMRPETVEKLEHMGERIFSDPAALAGAIITLAGALRTAWLLYKRDPNKKVEERPTDPTPPAS